MNVLLKEWLNGQRQTAGFKEFESWLNKQVAEGSQSVICEVRSGNDGRYECGLRDGIAKVADNLKNLSVPDTSDTATK